MISFFKIEFGISFLKGAPPTPNESSGSSTSAVAVGARAIMSDVTIESEKNADADKVKYVEGPAPLTPE